MNFLKKIWTLVRDVYFLLFCYSSECQLRAQKKKNIFQDEKSHLEKFDSYADLKKYQRRVKIFLTGMFSFGIIFCIIFFVSVLFLIQYLYSILNLENNIFDWGRLKDSVKEKIFLQDGEIENENKLIIKN
jgi:hypothetical protein